MKTSLLQHLLQAARQEPPPLLPPEFAADVLRAIHQDKPAAPAPRKSTAEQLNLLFPKLAWAMVLLTLLGLAAEFYSSRHEPGIAAGVSAMTVEWAFATP